MLITTPMPATIIIVVSPTGSGSIIFRIASIVMAPTAINKRTAFNKAVEWNYLSVNPFTKVKFPKLSKTFPVFISEDELLIILANTQYQHLKDIFTVAFYTGLRLGELVNMRWHWVDFIQNQITVKCSNDFQTKSKKERIVPMSEKVRSILFRRFYLSSHYQDEVVFYRRKGIMLYQ